LTSIETAPRQRALALHPQVALRPEPFGALAYHYGNRRLVFLKHPDLVAVVRALGGHPTIDAAFDAVGIAGHRRPAFERAIASMIESDMLIDAGHATADQPTEEAS
jgi:putative mycofactocin binding protein MftB